MKTRFNGDRNKKAFIYTFPILFPFLSELISELNGNSD